MGPSLQPTVILETLRELKEHISVPLWLFGGVAVDFLVGRWTRPHSDIDLNAFSHQRGALAEALDRIGYTSEGSEWLSFWVQASTGRRLEIAFLDQRTDGEAELLIPAGAAVGKPGRYATSSGYMRMDRWATLDDVTFRVCSPEGEWLARRNSVVAGRKADAKISHDLALLETILTDEQIVRLESVSNATRG
jgi:hypothetical protein